MVAEKDHDENEDLDVEDLAYEDEDPVCPNCGQQTEGESVCPYCGAILTDEEDELDGFHEDDGP